MNKLKYVLLYLWCAVAVAQNVSDSRSLTGVFKGPDGTPLNGYIQISLRGATFKNKCAVPMQPVQTKTQRFPIVNGLANYGTATFLSTDCLMPRLPYYIETYDATNNMIYSDNWYVPRLLGTSVDVGMMAPQRMGAGPTTVAIPQGVVATPQGTQTINQPNGTSFTLNGTFVLNGTTIDPSFYLAAATSTSDGRVKLDPNAKNNVLSSIASTGILTNAIGPRGFAGPGRGIHAMNGFSENFTSSARCNSSGTGVEGFDHLSGSLSCATPGLLHPSASPTYFEIDRNLAYGTTNAQPPPPNHWSLGITATLANGNNGGGAASNCAVGVYNCGIGNEVGMFINNGGFGYYVGSSSNLVFQVGNSSNGGNISGANDSGFSIGWNGPTLGALYDMQLSNNGDGTLTYSVMPAGGHLCAAACGFVERFPFTAPSGNTHQFVVRANGTQDYIGNIGGTDAPQKEGQRAPVSDFPPGGTSGMRRFAIHTNGVESTYVAGDCPAAVPFGYKSFAEECMNVFVMLPATYDPKQPNPWIVHFRGNETNSLISLYTDYDINGGNMADTLFQAGYVWVTLDFHTNQNYGSPQAVNDVAQMMSIVRANFNLASSPHAVADSAGGIMMLNSITHGTFLPSSFVCYSCNTSLAIDATGGYGEGQQMGLIQAAYGFTDPTQYATATAGYDPDLVAANPVNDMASTGTGNQLLLPHAAQVLASIPSVFTCEGSDGTVNCAHNSVQIANELNAINPGIANVVTPNGAGHVVVTDFGGINVLNFFQAH